MGGARIYCPRPSNSDGGGGDTHANLFVLRGGSVCPQHLLRCYSSPSRTPWRCCSHPGGRAEPPVGCPPPPRHTQLPTCPCGEELLGFFFFPLEIKTPALQRKKPKSPEEGSALPQPGAKCRGVGVVGGGGLPSPPFLPQSLLLLSRAVPGPSQSALAAQLTGGGSPGEEGTGVHPAWAAAAAAPPSSGFPRSTPAAHK